MKFAGRACLALGAGAGVFQGFCAVGQLLARRTPKVDAVSVALPFVAGVLLLAYGRSSPGENESSEGWRPDSGSPRPIQRVETRSDLAYSIIVPVYNRPRDIAALLKRLGEFSERWTNLGRGEIVVIDDGSTDNTGEVAVALAERSAMETRVITQKNAGSAGARNTGFAHARGAIGVSIDSDCLPYEDWLPNLLRHVPANEAVIAFGTVCADRRARMPLEVSPAGIEFITASFATPVDVFCRLGGFFPGFNGQFKDDTDFVLSARRAGIDTVQADDAVVWHPIRRCTTLESVWRMGLTHRFDVLLARRHGEAAIPFASNSILGGSWWGNFPTSCVFLGAVCVLIVSLFSELAGTSRVSLGMQAFGWAGMVVGILALGALGVLYHRVPLAAVPRYFASVMTYTLGATVGRMVGMAKYRLALL